MPSLTEIVRTRTTLDADDTAWLHRLVSQWQIVADLSFADLVLWLPSRTEDGFWGGAQVRPTTGPTAYLDDVVGTFLPRGEHPVVDSAWVEGRIVREGDPEWRGDMPVRMEAIPVRRAGRVVALVGRSTNLQGVRTPSRLELAYLQTAGELSQMIAGGSFPHPDHDALLHESPRVGDGFVRVDDEGRVTYSSPNALSVYRRLGLAGDLHGQQLPEVTRGLVPARWRQDEEAVSAVLGGRVPRDIELGNGQATVAVRAIPLCPDGDRSGAVVLVRDVTELRRRERELVTKDATIREIHHRVKNNLQTVAALLRLQARRVSAGPGREALEEAVRRVGSIAVVHELLSRSHAEDVDFDEVADRLARLVADIGRPGQVRTLREGSLGRLDSERATQLAMVLTELMQNAVEHGFPDAREGTMTLLCRRQRGSLEVDVTDDGRGLPAGFVLEDSGSLGLSIVGTLVAEMGGVLSLATRPAGGTIATLRLPLGEEGE